MGAVFKVAMPVTGKIMALKLLAPSPFLVSLVGRAEIERRFIAEAATLAGLNHPNVAAVWDFGRIGRRPYFLMEYYCRDLGQVIGETAEVEAPTRRLPLPRAVSYALQTLEGLARLHHAGIVHRDIKPFNLLLTDEDQIKITDFGLSKVRGEALVGASGLKVGSPYYAAPEQEDDPDLAGPKADLYSIGVALYRMLTGMLPVWPLKEQTLPSALSQDLDGVWDDYFLRVLSPKPETRHRGAREMAAELAALLEGWKVRLERACRLAVEDHPKPCPIPPSQERARREPIKISGKHTREQLGLDLLWRPRCYAPQNLVPAAGKVLDDSSGLEWQMSGSPYRLTWHEAQEYVAKLNSFGFAGSRDWRLPTVDEFSRILSPPREFTGHCLNPVFDQEQRLLWSSDRRAFTQAWFADTELGAFAWADMTCRRHVRAVRTA
jgi:serine/threonine-protein kinase